MRRTMPTKFVLLSTQRSGSTWVIDTLNSHPAVVSYGELLLQDGRGRPPFGAQDRLFWESYNIEQKSNAETGFNKNVLYKYLDDVFKTRPGILAAGFKLMYGQYGAYPDLHDYFVSNNVHIAHLIRRNYLDVIISREVAAARDIYHVREKESFGQPTVRLNVAKIIDSLIRHEKLIENACKKFSALSLPYSELNYEELRSDPARINTTLSFLGVPPSDTGLKSQLRRIITAAHSDVIENYPEVKRALANTRFSHLLH